MPDNKPSLIISTYNWPEALALVFQSVKNQTLLPGEVIVADDGSGPETTNVIDDFRKQVSFPVIHIWHEDKGFRKTQVLNRAIETASYDYIVQTDGDIILNKYFLQDHIRFAEPGYFIKGSRGMITQETSISLLEHKRTINLRFYSKGVRSKINATRCPFVTPLFFGNANRSNDLRGCNFGAWKKDLIAVNGYNNDFEGWGHEDIELAARLINYGIKRRQLKHAAVCFHLFHKINDRSSEEINLGKYRKAVEEKLVRCNNGIFKEAGNP